MPKLDDRLVAVTKLIRSSTHVDIGSDHGGLLVSMLKSGRIDYGIAIENKQQPYDNSKKALAGLHAEARFGNGLEVLEKNEAQSLSICGMGAESIVEILEAFPERVPERVVLQPNRQPELIRAWALRSGFHFVDELTTHGSRPFTILSFLLRAANNNELDPAYENVDRRAALLFGPLILKRAEPQFIAKLREEETYWNGFEKLEPERTERLKLIRKTLAFSVAK